MNTCIFRDNLIDDAGVFWLFAPLSHAILQKNDGKFFPPAVIQGAHRSDRHYITMIR